MKTTLLFSTAILALTLLSGCANSGNNGSGIHSSNSFFPDRCTGLSRAHLSQDVYCQQLEDKIIDDAVIRLEIEREIISREIDDALLDPDYGVE